MKPSISCVIPAYNRENSVVDAIESVLEQTRRPNEIIIIDDGSTDKTREVCLRYGDDVRVITQVNGGASSARNRGAVEAHGDWVAWLDSDDIWTASYLENVEKAIVATESQASLYFSNVELDEEQFESSKVWDHINFDFKEGEQFRLIKNSSEFAYKHHFMAMLQASVMKKSVFKSMGGFDEALKVHEDLFLFLRFFLTQQTCAVNQIGAVMGKGAVNRLSNSNLLSKHRDSLSMWKKLRHLHPNMGKKWLQKCYLYEAKALKRIGKYQFLSGNIRSGGSALMKAFFSKMKSIT